MAETLTINKADVLKEVNKTTGYIGTKMEEDKSAYGRIATTEENEEILDRFWDEACTAATDVFKPFISSFSSDITKYEVNLNMPSSFDSNLTPSMVISMFSYFVSYIISRWNKFSNKAEVESYAADALGAMDDVRKKLYWRKKPTRVAPTI